MLGSVYAKSLRDRWTAVVGAGSGIGLLLWMAMAVYAEIDTSFYYELPAAFLEAVGISAEVGGIGGIAYGAMYNLMGAMTLAGVAISFGASAIAGEVRAGTLGLLLANPRSRTDVTVSKLASMATLLAGGGLIYLGAALLVPAVLGVDITGIHVAALMLHLTVNALVWGMVAFAIGGWTGNRGAAVGVAAGTMVASWLATSFLPLIEGLADVAKVFPWYWFNGSQPELNGVGWGHLGLQVGLSVVLGAVALVGVRRRDLRGASTGTTILDRLRTNPRTQAIVERLAGSARVSGITARTISDHQALLSVVLAIVFYMALLVVPMYNLLPDSIGEVFSNLPEAMIAAIGGVDLSTPSGWIQGELLASVFPIAVITLFASMGSRALAGEEENRTMGMLLASPISRGRVLVHKALAMVVFAVVLAVGTFAGLAIGVLIAGFDLPIVGVAAASVLGSLLGLVFGGVALLIGAATGRVKLAVYGAAGLGVVAYFVDSFFPLAESFEPFAVLSPFHYFLSSDPLVNGMDWGHAGVLVGIFVVLVAAAVPLFDRRDLRG